jgi:acetyl esterase/lipase
VERDITYCTRDGVELKMDLYRPEEPNGAAVLYIHGGGWTSGSKTGGIGSEMWAELLGRGHLVAAIDYRLAPEYQFPAQMEDVTCAGLAATVTKGASPRSTPKWRPWLTCSGRPT